VTAVNFHNVAVAYFQAGWNATDPAVKFENFAKSAQYREGELKAVEAAGQSPTAAHFGNIAEAYFHTGWNATDPAVKFENFTNAKKFFEILLEKGVDEGVAQKVRENLAKISIYLSEFKKSTHHDKFDDQRRDG